MSRASAPPVAAWARAAARRARPVASALRGRARREPVGRRVLWIAVAALLTLVPLALNLARAPRHEATTVLFPVRVEPYPAIRDPAHYLTLLGDPVLREQMRLNVGQGVARYGDVGLRRTPAGGQLFLTVPADTPEDAQRFVNALAPQIVEATRRQLAVRAARDAVALGERLRQSRRRRVRAELRRDLRRLERLANAPEPRLLAGARSPRPELERWADRLVDGLPGDFPPRPAPAWAALAGLLLAATLWTVALAVAPPRRSPPPGG